MGFAVGDVFFLYLVTYVYYIFLSARRIYNI